MKLRVLAGTLLAAMTAATPQAAASPPVLTAVGHDRFHPWATFSAPGADSVTIHFATSAERATDGNFFAENVTGTETFTDEEIAAGRWLSEETYGLSGKRWLMLSAVSYSCPEGADCAEGFSNVLEFTVPSRTLQAATARDSIRDGMSRGRLGREWDAGYNHRVNRCKRLSRLRVRCNLSWVVGDLEFSGRAAVVRRAGANDRVRWTVKMLDAYCDDTSGRRCTKTFRGAADVE